MRVLVTTSVFPRWPGDATPPFVFNLCRDLAEAGCKITILAPHSPGSPLTETMEGLRIVRFRYFWPESLQNLFYEGGMIVRLREKKARSLQLPFMCIAQYFAVQNLLKEGFDLIHAHSLLPQGLICGIAKSSGIPLIVSSHGSDVFLLKKQWRPFLEMAVRRADALIANSTATRERLLQLGASPAQVHKIPATPNYPDPDKPTHRFPERPILLFAGRLIHEKGIDALVEAMPGILKELPSCTLRVAGSGNLEAPLQHRTKELGIDKSITFLGWLNPEHLREEMRHATLLVAPSRVIEGQNLVVTEALSVGCPVATTPRGGVLDLVKDGETGFVIPDSETEIMATTILDCLNSPKSMQKIGRQGFAHFSTGFSRRQVTSKTVDLYGREIANA